MMIEKPDLQASARQLYDDVTAAISQGILPDVDAAMLVGALSGVVFEISVIMVSRDPVDPEAATEFATKLMLGGLANLPKRRPGNGSAPRSAAADLRSRLRNIARLQQGAGCAPQRARRRAGDDESPGSSVRTWRARAPGSASKIRSSVLLSCITWPLTRVMMRSGSRPVATRRWSRCRVRSRHRYSCRRELAARLLCRSRTEPSLKQATRDHRQSLFLGHVALQPIDRGSASSRLVGMAGARHLAVVRHQRVVVA